MHQKSKAESGKNLAQEKDRNNRWLLGSMTFNSFPNKAGFMNLPPMLSLKAPHSHWPCSWGLIICGCHLEIVHLIFEFVFLKWSLLRKWNMRWWPGASAQEKSHPPQVFSLRWAFSHPLFHSLVPQATPISPYLSFPRTLLPSGPFWSLDTRRINLLGTGCGGGIPIWGWQCHSTLSRFLGWGRFSPISQTTYWVHPSAQVAIPCGLPIRSVLGEQRNPVGRGDWLLCPEQDTHVCTVAEYCYLISDFYEPLFHFFFTSYLSIFIFPPRVIIFSYLITCLLPAALRPDSHLLFHTKNQQTPKEKTRHWSQFLPLLFLFPEVLAP